jgi:hypothetical protein
MFSRGVNRRIIEKLDAAIEGVIQSDFYRKIIDFTHVLQ